jgi:hypothetical protein
VNSGTMEPLSTEHRDSALGAFMDAWSELEGSLRNLLRILSGAPSEISFSIAAAIPDNGRLKELLLALGRIQLTKIDDCIELQKICEYLLVSNRYRNSIIHGQWICTNNREPGPEPRHRYMWVRVYQLIDKAKEFEAAVGIDKKAADQYVFTIPRLKERAQKARDFAERVKGFSEKIEGRVRKPKRRR